MRLRGVGRVAMTWRRLRNRFAHRTVILLYHRVADIDCDPWLACVTPGRFAEQMEVLRRSGIPLLRLGEVPQATAGRRSVAITFDDGYADNHANVLPVLEQFEIPATFFLVSGRLGHPGEFWWDDLERILLTPGRLPAELTLNIGSAAHTWRLDDAVEYSYEQWRNHRSWRGGKPGPTPRHGLYNDLYRLLVGVPTGMRARCLGDLRRWAGLDEKARPSHRTLSKEQTAALARSELVEIGAHTAGHALLSALPSSEQEREIGRSKRDLEDITGKQVASFAYPYGRQTHYTSETLRIVEEAGFTRACSNFQRAAGEDSGRYELPRMQVRDWTGDDFEKHLRRVFLD